MSKEYFKSTAVIVCFQSCEIGQADSGGGAEHVTWRKLSQLCGDSDTQGEHCGWP